MTFDLKFFNITWGIIVNMSSEYVVRNNALLAGVSCWEILLLLFKSDIMGSTMPQRFERKTDAPRDYLSEYIYVAGCCVCAHAAAEQMKSLNDWKCEKYFFQIIHSHSKNPLYCQISGLNSVVYINAHRKSKYMCISYVFISSCCSKPSCF